MDDMDMIQGMVKGREECRRIVVAYERARSRSGSALACPDSGVLDELRGAAERLVMHLRRVPGRADRQFRFMANARYAEQLLDELRILLERALILERESRFLLRAQGGPALAHATAG